MSLSSASVVARLRAAGCVYAEDEARLLIEAAGTAEELVGLVTRRVAGEPLEHVIGWAYFLGRRVAVAPGVFVPRLRTEYLVELAAALTAPGAVVVDLCCGCGAVGAALAATREVELHSVDLDPVAVRCARRNVGQRATVYQGDLYGPLPRRLCGLVDVVVANAPYVPTEAIGWMPREARLHEPRMALDGGPDGLDIVRRITVEAPRWLTPQGSLLVEAGEDQAPQAIGAARDAGFVARVATSRALGATVIVATGRQGS